MLGGVTLLAIHAGVLSFQHVSRLFMIERFGVPFDDGEIDAVVVGVAFDTFLAGARAQAVGEVQSLVSIEATGDLGMALEALEGGLSARQLVAIGTMRSAAQSLMRASERAGRDLGGRKRGGQNRQDERQEKRTCEHENGNGSMHRAVRD